MNNLKEWANENKVLITLAVITLTIIAGFIWFSGIFFGKAIGKLDNRPRWMMGGLRDDTGSHNAKDVFGMGFGLD